MRDYFDYVKHYLMGGTSSSPKKQTRGCWRFRKELDDDEYTSTKLKRPRSLTKLRLNSDSSRGWSEFNDIPTPSVYDRNDLEYPAPPPTEEKIKQLITCFPFPVQQQSVEIEFPTDAPITTDIPLEANCDEHSFSNAFGKLVQVSVETMAITALPMDVWLRERLKKWVQLSGHEGSIVPASIQTLYKKLAGSCEARAYEAIMKDHYLEGLTPKFYKEIQKNDESFIEIEDLLHQFADPSKTAIMDIKVGCRTFLESEVTNAKKRSDLYQKMIAIDPEEPTPEERAAGEITKLRYMQFRERESSSAQLGFRIEAAKLPGGCLQKNFKKVRNYDDVMAALTDFFGPDRVRVRNQLLARLRHMRTAIEKSDFFSCHEVVGSSILIMYDGERVGCWMIDFAKSHHVTDRIMDHRTPWSIGNHEDGYLIGIDNLIKILEDLPARSNTITEETCML